MPHAAYWAPSTEGHEERFEAVEFDACWIAVLPGMDWVPGMRMTEGEDAAAVEAVRS